MSAPSVRRCKISSVSFHVPEGRLTNADLEKKLDTSDEWITTRTGIRERRISSQGEASSDLALPAARQALQQRGLSPEQLQLLIVATVSPDQPVPPTASILQEKLGARNAWGFDLDAACSSFIFALAVGEQFIRGGAYDRVMIVGSDVMSSIVDYQDRSTCILFGDGAGVVLLEPAGEGEEGILDHLLQMDGSYAGLLHVPAGGSERPATLETVGNRLHFVRQDGRQVFKCAIEGMAEVSRRILESNGYGADDVAMYVPHQANARIITSAARRIGLPMERVCLNIDRFANTTSATIPICLAELQQAGRLKRGDLVLLATFGAGFTWGASLLRWELP